MATVIFSHGQESGPWGTKITAMAEMESPRAMKREVCSGMPKKRRKGSGISPWSGKKNWCGEDETSTVWVVYILTTVGLSFSARSAKSGGAAALAM